MNFTKDFQACLSKMTQQISVCGYRHIEKDATFTNSVRVFTLAQTKFIVPEAYNKFP